MVAGFGTPAATKTVSLVVNGKTMATRKVEVPANGRATVEFAPLDVGYGFNRCEVRIDGGDAFPADDASVFAVRRSDPERVLFVHAGGDTRSAAVLRRGAGCGGAGRPSSCNPCPQEQTTDLDPSRFAFVVLSDSAGAAGDLRAHACAICRRRAAMCSSRSEPARRVARAFRCGAAMWRRRTITRAMADAATVGQVDFTHPALLDAQPGRDNGGWAETKVFYAAVVDPRGARVVARLSDGTPLLLDKQMGEGHVLLFASGLENLTNDLPLHPVFVAFVDHVARYLSGSERLSGSRLVDSFVQLRVAGRVGIGAGQRRGDRSGWTQAALAERGADRADLAARARGLLSDSLCERTRLLIGVNPDRRESNLQPIADDVQQLWSGSAGSGASQTEAASTQEEKYRP